MNEKIQQFENRITQLENLLKGLSGDASFNEVIRNIVIVDSQSSNATQNVVTSVDFTAKTTTTVALPAGTFVKYGRIYFRGQLYNVPLYKIS